MATLARIPLAVVLLGIGAVVAALFNSLHISSPHAVEVVLTVALVCILFDGGMHIGVSRFRSAAAPILTAGVLGTFATTSAGALVLHLLGLSWFPAVLVATAVAPTDPAVVFSVLGKHRIAGRSSTILEGESGANDPVGIALMSSLLAAGALTAHAAGRVGVEFLLQMLVGAAVGAGGGWIFARFSHWVIARGTALAFGQSAVCAAAVYLLAWVAHGSGFLAVFVAGIVLGDEVVPHRDVVRRAHGVLATVAEVVAFVVLGLTVELHVLIHRDVWLPGLVLAGVLAALARPVLVGLCLGPARLSRQELTFVLFAGLKGAVPLLLGQLIIAHGTPEGARLYGIVVVVVVLSVALQGTFALAVAHRLGLVDE